MVSNEKLLDAVKSGFSKLEQESKERWANVDKQVLNIKDKLNHIDKLYTEIAGKLAGFKEKVSELEHRINKHSKKINDLHDNSTQYHHKMEMYKITFYALLAASILAFSAMVSWYAGQPKQIISPLEAAKQISPIRLPK